MRYTINLIIFGLVVRQLKKIMYIPKKDVKSLLAIQTLWQVRIKSPKEIKHPYYKATKTKEWHQFDLLYIPNNVFEENTYTYILTSVYVASRY